MQYKINTIYGENPSIKMEIIIKEVGDDLLKFGIKDKLGNINENDLRAIFYYNQLV